MRWTIAYYLMLLYITVMIKPVIPIVCDTLSHIFSETEHIATVHAMYGINHLEKELSNTTTDNNSRQASISPEELLVVHIAPAPLVINFGVSKPLHDYALLKADIYNSISILKETPPPKGVLLYKEINV